MNKKGDFDFEWLPGFREMMACQNEEQNTQQETDWGNENLQIEALLPPEQLQQEEQRYWKDYEYFDMVLSSKDVKRGKPFPDVFLEICKAFDVKPEETLVLEDSANGVQAALAGNLPVINIPDLLPIPKEQQEKCVAVVENLKEVIPYI